MNKPSVRVDYTDQFKRDLKQLNKKYRHLEDDLQPLLDQLITGETPGDQVPNIGYTVYKVRVGSRDQAKGKRGGFRVLYYVRTVQFILLVRIYPKGTRADLPAEVIRRIIQEYEQSNL